MDGVAEGDFSSTSIDSNSTKIIQYGANKLSSNTSSTTGASSLTTSSVNNSSLGVSDNASTSSTSVPNNSNSAANTISSSSNITTNNYTNETPTTQIARMHLMDFARYAADLRDSGRSCEQQENDPTVGIDDSANNTAASTSTLHSDMEDFPLSNGTILKKYILTNKLLYIDWTEKLLRPHTVTNVKNVKALMKPRCSPRKPFFNKNHESLKFNFKDNMFLTGDKNWAATVAHQLYSWENANSLLVDRPVKLSKNPGIVKIERDEHLNTTHHRPETYAYYDEEGRTSFRLEKNEPLPNKYAYVLSAEHDWGDEESYLAKSFKEFNVEQQAFIREIRDIVLDQIAIEEPDVKFILLTGHAGCGKTSTLHCLNLIGNVSILYIAITQRLTAAARRNYNINASTFCSFAIKVLNMPAKDVMLMTDAFSYLENKFFQHDFFDFSHMDISLLGDLFPPTMSVSNIDNNLRFMEPVEGMDIKPNIKTEDSVKQEIKTEDVPEEEAPSGSGEPPKKKLCGFSEHFFLPAVNILFLDEISMFTPSQLEFFTFAVKAISETLKVRFIVVLAGDFMQISPMFTVSTNYDVILNLCCSHHNLTIQHRILDIDYLNVVMQLTENPLPDSQQFLNDLKNVCGPEKCTNLIDYVYPFELSFWAYELLANTGGNFHVWLDSVLSVKPNFFDLMLDFCVFCFTNDEMHYTNIAIGMGILSQFRRREISTEETIKYIKFSTFNMKDSTLQYPYPMSGAKTIIQILPLIRFFPYKTLFSTSLIPNKSIVYLLHWNTIKGYVVIWWREKNLVLQVYNCVFKMNMTNSYLFGIPLELAVANTFHSSQGLTLSNDVAISLKNIDYRELFVALTRVRNSSQIKCFF